jgi:predicted RNase H-like nuclease (RuvC/YqgF family)
MNIYIIICVKKDIGFFNYTNLLVEFIFMDNNNSSTTVSNAETTISTPTQLQKLDEEFLELSKREDHLKSILASLKEQEETLQKALKEASETGQERLQKQRRQKDEQAMARLEQAWMESSSEDEDTKSNFDLMSFMGNSKHE